MKKLALVSFVSIMACISCNHPNDTSSKNSEQKKLFSDVLKMHDQVMAKDDEIQLYNQQLDTLLKQKPALKGQISGLKTDISVADSSMMNWMHQFKSDVVSQPSAQAVTYLTEQKQKLAKVDAELHATADKASKFISQNK